MRSIAQTSLTEAESRALERFVTSLEAELGDALVGVWLFGSRARGEQPRGESDVDVLVLSRRGRKDRATVTRLASEAQLSERGVLLSTQTEAPEWVEERRAIEDFFIRDVDRDRVVLAGSP